MPAPRLAHTTQMTFGGLTFNDWLALAFFGGCWLAYHMAVERTLAGRSSLNRLMNVHRYAWARVTLVRDNRIVDSNINATLQNGAAFFASTSLIAVGGALTILRSSEEIIVIFAEMPFGAPTTRIAWEIKAMGLAVIFVYAFFKFAWSYRLFNYAAILIGAIPITKGAETPEAERAAWRSASMNTVAGRHFNRGQRAFFFALAYLGWFVSPLIFMGATAAVLYVMWRRQFASDAIAALSEGPWPPNP